MKNPWIIIGAVAVVLFGSAIWYGGVATEKNNEGVTIVEHVKGNPEATVVLTEYSDLQCPACAAFHPYVKNIVDQYSDSVRFEYKHFPLPANIHPYAMQASIAAEAAGQQGKFFEFHDKMFENQAVWSVSPTPNAIFIQYAEELGLDMDLFKRHMKSTVLKERVETQFAEGKEAGVTGTPTFFLNGERMNFTTYQEFITQVSAAVDPDLAEFLRQNSGASTTPTSDSFKFGL